MKVSMSDKVPWLDQAGRRQVKTAENDGTKGLCKVKKNQKIRVNYGSGLVGPGLTREKILENRPKIDTSRPTCTDILEYCRPSMFSVFIHRSVYIEVVSYYDLSVLSI